MRGNLGSSLQRVITVNALVPPVSNGVTAKFLRLLRIHAKDFGKGEHSYNDKSPLFGVWTPAKVRTV
jgi:hypothetical protein